jgi:hypothetical protein
LIALHEISTFPKRKWNHEEKIKKCTEILQEEAGGAHYLSSWKQKYWILHALLETHQHHKLLAPRTPHPSIIKKKVSTRKMNSMHSKGTTSDFEV